ncbi:MAG: hypothetical protein A2070_10425 [Bdellovibrionales bacterium GWC1_52_8]|nr:MAG: hypothetical protein A2Z97_05185 [Bdellovibrionales bacterium GWB1_52_6]OFZ04584.1 MAG: hypothetical protein A2X97_13260 [Bdellovibrionales bacterium GWA1_52_35]OFZ42961.1 MAG: hypothetical protein A2070_10425 [Bdellovibrionales bacterium GWC1_52_8]
MKKISAGIQEYLSGIANAFFLDHPLFGAGLLLLVSAFDFRAFLIALYSSLLGYAFSRNYSTPKVLKHYGLISLNGFFFGLAMAHFFESSVTLYLCVLLGSLALPYFVKASHEVLQHWKLSPFIFPYIAVVWIFWLSAPGFSLTLNPQAWPPEIAALPGLHTAWGLPLRLADALFLSAGRLLFIPNASFGLAATALLFVFSPRRAIYFIAGTGCALLGSYLLSTGAGVWEYGYFSYSAGLVGLGLASFPQKYSWRTIFIFCTFSCFITIAADQFLKRIGLPALSLPYVLTLWLAILSRVPRISLSWAPDQRLLVPARAQLKPAVHDVHESENAA